MRRICWGVGEVGVGGGGVNWCLRVGLWYLKVGCWYWRVISQFPVVVVFFLRRFPFLSCQHLYPLPLLRGHSKPSGDTLEHWRWFYHGPWGNRASLPMPICRGLFGSAKCPLVLVSR